MNDLASVVRKPVARRLLRCGAAAAYLGISPKTLRRLSDLGEVRAKDINGQRRFDIKDLDAFIDRAPDWKGRSA